MNPGIQALLRKLRPAQAQASGERPANVIPDGLVRCPVCGELRGAALVPEVPGGDRLERVVATCLCDGLVCGHCGVGRIHRPISNFYSEKDGHVWHVPHFAAMRQCENCGRSAWVIAAERSEGGE